LGFQPPSMTTQPCSPWHARMHSDGAAPLPEYIGMPGVELLPDGIVGWWDT